MENRYVVFDWDGTLHNTKKLYAESVRKAYAFLESVAGGRSDEVVEGRAGEVVEGRAGEVVEGRADEVVGGRAGEVVEGRAAKKAREKQDAGACKSHSDAMASGIKGFTEKSANELTEENLSKYLGMTAAAMWADFMPGLEESIRAKAEKIVGDSMVELVYNRTAILYDGVTRMLDELKAAGFKLMILSNCKTAYLEAHKEVFKLDQWFTDYYPAQAYDFIPKEDILKMAMEKYPGEYVMVGDRYLDIKAGNECGVRTIGCSYGFGTAEELSEADCIADSPLDIVKLVIN